MGQMASFFFFGLFSLSVPFPWVNHGDGLTRQNQGVSDTLAGRRGIVQHRVQNQMGRRAVQQRTKSRRVWPERLIVYQRANKCFKARRLMPETWKHTPTHTQKKEVDSFLIVSRFDGICDTEPEFPADGKWTRGEIKRVGMWEGERGIHPKSVVVEEQRYVEKATIPAC